MQLTAKVLAGIVPLAATADRMISVLDQ